MANPPRLLGFSGSLRRESNSTAVLQTLREVLAPDIRIETFDIGTLPHYNADLDGEHAPESARALKSAIAASDAVLIVTPEYNYGVPGVLKNAIDWASRPAFQSVFKGKLVGIISTSRGYVGGTRAQAQLKYNLIGMLAEPFPWPEVIIGMSADKVRDGRLHDEATLKISGDMVRALAAEAVRRTDPR